MGKISNRLADIARNAGDLSPIAEPLRQILWEGNRERALRGEDAQGQAFAPLSPATLKNRKGDGPALAPRRGASRIVTGFVVHVIAGVGRLSFTGSWPGLDWVRYHADGGRRLPRRDPFGFTNATLEKARALLRQHVMKSR